MTTGSIEFACPYCERVTRVPASYGGKQGKCPGCQKVIEVPAVDGLPASQPAPAAMDPAAAMTVPVGPPPAAIGGPVAADAPTIPPAGLGAPLDRAKVPEWQQQFVRHVGPAAGAAGAGEDDGGPQRPCPFCGESIKAAAKKCKYCGEFLDERARAQQRMPQVGRLASVGARLGARVIDVIICYVPTWAMIFGGVMAVDPNVGRNEALGGALMILALLYFAASSFVQWYFIATTGQSLGKRWLGIKIVRTDGAPAGFVNGVILREWITFGILVVGNLICYLGCITNAIGYLLCLADDRKCLHDHIASTVVIDV